MLTVQQTTAKPISLDVLTNNTNKKQPKPDSCNTDTCGLTSNKEILYLYSFTTVGVFEHSYIVTDAICGVAKLYMSKQLYHC